MLTVLPAADRWKDALLVAVPTIFDLAATVLVSLLTKP